MIYVSSVTTKKKGVQMKGVILGTHKNAQLCVITYHVVDTPFYNLHLTNW